MQARSQPICICFKITFYEDWVSNINKKKCDSEQVHLGIWYSNENKMCNQDG